MDLDNIKDIWSEENPDKTPEISLEKQKEIKLPLEKIRQNIKSIFLNTALVYIVFIGFIIYMGYLNSQTSILRWIAFIVVFTIILLYYYSKFYKLYKKLSDKKQYTFEFLNDLKYDLKLHLEYLKSYYVAIIPLFLAEMLILLPAKINFDQTQILKIIVGGGILLTIMYFRIKYYVNKNYQKPIENINQLIEDLK